MKIRLIALLSVFLFLGACATQPQPQQQIKWRLDQAGDAVEVLEPVPPPEFSWDNVLKTTLIIGGALVGVYVLGEVFDVWDDDSSSTTTTQPSNGLVPISGTQQSSFDTQFIYPSYAPVQ